MRRKQLQRAAATALTRYVVNPVMTRAVDVGIGSGGWSILETRGRKTGKPRRTPVGDGLVGDTFWIVAEHGRHAGYVRNIERDARVRVKVRGRWRSGVAHVLPDDDPLERQRTLGHPVNSALVRLVGTELLTVRIDLDP